MTIDKTSVYIGAGLVLAAVLYVNSRFGKRFVFSESEKQAIAGAKGAQSVSEAKSRIAAMFGVNSLVVSIAFDAARCNEFFCYFSRSSRWNAALNRLTANGIESEKAAKMSTVIVEVAEAWPLN